MKGAYGKARLGTIALLSVAAFAIMAAAAAAPRASMAAKHPATIAAPKANAPSAAAKLHVADLYGKLPLRFERNDGQTDARAKFLSRGDGYMLFLTPTEAVLALRKPGKASRPDSSPPSSSLSSRAKSAKSREPGSGIFFDKLRTGSRAAATRENDRIKDDVSARVESEVVRVKIVGGNPMRRFRVSINSQASPITSSATTPRSGIPMCPTTRKLNSRVFIPESTSSTTAANRVNSNTTSGLRRAPIRRRSG